MSAAISSRVGNTQTLLRAQSDHPGIQASHSIRMPCPPQKKEGENLLNKWAVGWKEKPGLPGMELEHGKLHSMSTTKTLLRICDIVICQRTIYI